MSGNRNITNLYDQFGDEAVWFYSFVGMPSSSNLLQDPESYSNNRTVNYAAMWGNSNSYSLSEVKGETSTSYDLKVTTAVNFTVGATLDYNAEMFAPGTYRSYRSNLPWGSFPSDRNASVQNATLNDVVVNNVVGNGQMRGAISIVADMTVSKADLSISSMATSTEGYVNGEFELKNYPGNKLSNEQNGVNFGNVELLTRTFDNYDVSFSMNITSELATAFAPSLDLYHFPINAGESWTVASTATTSGNVGGAVDVVGLPADMKNRMLANNPYNLTGFPIDLASIYNPNMGGLQNGKVSTVKDISLSIKATGPRTIYDPTLGTINVLDLQYNGTGTSGIGAGGEKITILADNAHVVGIGSPQMRPAGVQKATDGINLITRELSARPVIHKLAYTSRYVTGVTATVPTWNVGDKWALAGSKDLAAMFDALGEDKATLVSALTSSIYSSADVTRNRTAGSADLWGKISSSAVFEVVGETATDYQLRVRMGGEVVGGLDYSYNADIVNPGTYRTSRSGYGAPWGFLPSDRYANSSAAPTTNKDVTYSGSIDGATYMDANISVSRSNLSIGSIILTSGAYLKADMVATNVPKTNSSYDQKSGYASGSYYYASANLITVKDGDYNYTVDYRDNLNLTMLFSDYLQVMKFPMKVGDTWNKPTHIDVEGNITGHLDVTGLSANMNSSLMNALDQVHVSSLPINFAQMYGSNTTRFNNGTISIQTTIDPSFKCVKAYLVDDAIAGKVVAFQIAPVSKASPTESAYLRNTFSWDYLPSSGRISAINVDYVVDLGMKTDIYGRAEAALGTTEAAVYQGFAATESIVLTDGSVLELHQNHVVTIMLNGMQQTIELVSTNGTSSVFRVGGQEITLNIGESRQLDLNGDGTNDVSLLLSSVNGGSADFSVTNLGPGSGTTGAGNDLTLIAVIGVVAAVLVVGAVVLLMRRRRA